MRNDLGWAALAFLVLSAACSGAGDVPESSDSSTSSASSVSAGAAEVSDAARQARADGETSLRILPFDEAVRDPAFFDFRARLIRAVAARDTAALLAAVAPDIGLSFGGDAGIDRFREIWLDEVPELSHGIWTELGAVLGLGGRFYNESTFVAPYTFAPFHPGPRPAAYDPHSALMALSDAVPVRAAPGSMDTLALLSFDVVRWEWRTSVADPPPGWTAVRLATDSAGTGEGALGFVESDRVRSGLDYRAVFTRHDRRWRMSVLIAGD